MSARNEQFIRQLHEFLGTAQGSRYDKAAIIYEMILTAENPETAFKYFLEKADYIESSDEKEVEIFLSPTQMRSYDSEYGNLIDGLLNKLIMQHCEKEFFYKTLWEYIEQSDLLFEKKEAKIYALGKIWSDARIPYFQIGEGIKMSDDEFKRIIDKNKELLQEVTFILNCRFEQKTESSSRLLDVIERCDDIKEKTVVLAKILDLAEKRVILKMLNNRN